jgi:hypothetical protein
MGRQMFRDGGIVPMQYGGMAPTDMPPQDMGMAPPPMAPPPMAPPPMPPQDMGMPGEDEQMLMAGLSGAQNVLGDLDAASNVEEAINAIRQDAAPLEARRDELAEFVGPEDAARTPDSVLLLLQPVIIMEQASAAGDPMDAGVGGLAAGAMDVPVEGPMAEGIMSTVNMDPGPEAPMEGPPVNFNLGGSVRLAEILQEKRDTYRDQMGATEAEIKAATDAARNTAEANILFDTAAAGLNLAAGPVPGGSVMQNLAAAFSPVLANVPGRAAPINAVQADQKKYLQSLDLEALRASQAQLAAERAARAAERKAKITADATLKKAEIDAGAKPIGDIFRVTRTGRDGNLVIQDMPLSRNQYAEFAALGDPNFSVEQIPKPGTPQKAQNFRIPGGFVSAIPGTRRYGELVDQGATVVSAEDPSMFAKRTAYTITEPVNIDGVSYGAGETAFLTQMDIPKYAGKFTEYQPPVGDKEFFSKFGHTKAQFNALPEDKQNELRGIGLTDQHYFDKFRMPKAEFFNLPGDVKKRLQGIGPQTEIFTSKGSIVQINTQTGASKVLYQPDIATEIKTVKGEIVALVPDANSSTGFVAKSLFKTDTDPADADYYVINDAATVTQEIVDNSTPTGRARIANVNAQNAKAGSKRFTVNKMGTQQAPPRAQGFLLGNQNVLSYDNGRTYVTEDGVRKNMPTDAVILSPENAVEMVRQARMRAMAGNELKNLYAEMIPTMKRGKIVDGKVTRVPFSAEEMGLTKNAYEAALKGIGPYKSIGAFISGLSGLGPTSMQKAFVENEDNRNYIKAVTIMGRAALVANPRFAVAELQNVAKIFPTTGLFTNPEAEAQKLIRLKGVLTAQKLSNLRAITDGAISGDELKAALSQNYQINMTLMMLGSTPLPSSVPVEGQRTTPRVLIGQGRPIKINPPANPPANAVDPEL